MRELLRRTTTRVEPWLGGLTERAASLDVPSAVDLVVASHLCDVSRAAPLQPGLTSAAAQALVERLDREAPDIIFRALLGADPTRLLVAHALALRCGVV